MRPPLLAALLLALSAPAFAAEPLDVDSAARRLSLALGDALEVARGTGSVVSVVLEDIAFADPADAAEARLMTEVLRLNISTKSFALFQPPGGQQIAADLRISGELLRHGGDRRVFVRLTSTSSGQVLMTAGETLMPLPAAPQPSASTAAAQAPRTASPWWFDAAASFRHGTPGLHAGLAWRGCGPWELALDAGRFSRMEKHAKNVQVTVGGATLARQDEVSIEATYLRPKVSYLVEVLPRLTARAGAGFGLSFFTEGRRWQGISEAVSPLEQVPGAEYEPLVRGALLTEAGLAYEFAEGWGGTFMVEHVLGPSRAHPVSYDGWAFRAGLSARLPADPNPAPKGVLGRMAGGRELWLFAGPWVEPEFKPGFRVMAALRRDDEPLEWGIEYGRIVRESASTERVEGFDRQSRRALSVTAFRPTVAAAVPARRLASAAPAGLSARFMAGLPLFQLREERYAHIGELRPPVDEGRTSTTVGLSFETGLAYAWRFLEAQVAGGYTHGFGSADLVNLRYDGWSLRAGLGVRLF